MADVIARVDNTPSIQGVYPATGISWGAIWLGAFTFIAICSVFGILGEAIFASASSPATAAPTSGMSVGLGIWAIILTIIAMYVAGRATGHFTRSADRGGRIMHGMAMFGLSVLGVILMMVLGGTAWAGETGVAAGAHSAYILTIFADLGWIGFASLFLGWLAAMMGAAQGIAVIRTQTVATTNVHDIRTAA